MTKEEYLKELNKAFRDFKFFENGHYYEYKGKRVGISVTRFIEQYCNEFDAQAVAEKVAIKQNKTVQEVLDEWDYKNKFACEKGHLGHLYAQSLWNKENVFEEIKKCSEDVKTPLGLIMNQAEDFYDDYKDRLEHLADEFVVGSPEYDICSAIDHLFINKLTGGLVLVDYKTNSDIHKTEKYAKDMKVPLQHLKDFTLNHYFIQLSIYRYLVEKYTNLKIEEMFIVYFSENIENYEIIGIPYLKKEVEKILENRRQKGMKSVPILLIGKSGTGKSTSMRNFENDEIAVINVLGKQLPFKSKIKNIVTTDDYNKVIENIQKTSRKTIVIDDAGYLITNQFMRNHSKGGGGNAVFAVYNELADNFWKLVNAIKNIDGGKTVYFVMHEDSDEAGNIRPKTIGKLLDDKVCIEGMFTVAIRSMFKDGKYIFRTKTDGNDIVKSPLGMFEEEEIDNDLKEVDKIIREYYELDKVEEKEEEK